MPVALVQGASRGIGLQFCTHLLKYFPEASVIATCRNPKEAESLQKLEELNERRLLVQPLDVTCEGQIMAAASVTKEKFGKLDLLINASGMLHPSGKGETSLRDVSFQGLGETMITNTFGALMMAKHFAALLQKGEGTFGHQSQNKTQKHSSILVNISARVGSITENGLGGWYSYRMSKAALNMATKNLSIELGRGSRKVICVALHPGTVDTDLSRPYHKGVPADKLFSTEYCVNKLMEIINQLQFIQSGKYYSWDGNELPF